MNSQTESSLARWPLRLLLLAFVIPVVIAQLVLSLDLYQGGATNHGELIQPPISYTSLGLNIPAPKVWQVLYLLPSQCDASCQNRLYVLRQSQLALGKNKTRVVPKVLLSPESDTSGLNKLALTQAPVVASLRPWLEQQQILIIDPLGNFVLSYPQVVGEAAHLAQGKALMADLQKLLKLSRVD